MVLKRFFLGIPYYFTVIFLVLITSIILWLPFILHADNWFGLDIPNSNMGYVYKNYDGPFYVIPAKTLYDRNQIDIPGQGLIISLPLSAGYFAAHLPLYPLIIRIFGPLMGYLQSMLFVNVLFSIFLALLFYITIVRLHLSQHPLRLTAVFLLLPRFLTVRSVGAPESLFMFLILLSILFFEKKRYLLAGLFGGLSAMTKTPGILLFVAYTLVFIEQYFRTKQIPWKAWGIGLIPLGLISVFFLYAKQLGDFFAYFHSGDNIHLVFPFSVFNSQKPWVGTVWLEDILFYFFLYLMTVISLKDSKHRSFFYFPLVFFIAVLFVQHRDISRYSLPLWMFTCIAFEKFFISRRFLLVLLLLLPAIYMYGWNMIISNVVPISDWRPFL